MKKRIVVIYSGGMDSFTVLHRALAEHPDAEVFPLSVFYGQRHKRELTSAEDVCLDLGLSHKIINMDFMTDIADNSALTGDIEVPHGHYEEENMKLTVVPNRNMLLLSVAVAYAVNLGASEVWYGAHAGDHAIYPDCRQEFLEKMDDVAQIANWQSVSIKAPFIDGNKEDILRWGFEHGLDYGKTWTCYEGKDKACGKCGSCQERLEAFKNLGEVDPIPYEIDTEYLNEE